MMDNNDESKNHVNEEPGPQGKSDEIPYWLQGFDDDKPEETTPVEPENDEIGEWIPEPEEPYLEESAGAASQIEEIPTPDQNGVMDDIDAGDLDQIEDQVDTNEVPNEQNAIEREITEVYADSEITDEIEINDVVEHHDGEQDELAHNDGPSSEGFVDISDLDLSDTPVSEDDAIHNIEAREGDLPEWLQEMISEPDEPVSEEPEPIAFGEEPLPQKPYNQQDIAWQKESPEDDLLDIIPSFEEEVEKDDDEIDSEERDQDSKALQAIAEEDTAPISTTSPVISSSVSEEAQLSEDLEHHDNAQSLEDIEQLLLAGNFDEALSAANGFIQETNDCDELLDLLTQAAARESQANSAVWELIGDLSLKQEKPQDALEAYAKAIDALVINHEANNGTS